MTQFHTSPPNPYLKPALVVSLGLVVGALIIGHDLRPPRYRLITGADGRVFIMNNQTGAWLPYRYAGSARGYEQGNVVESVKDHPSGPFGPSRGDERD